jgi:aminoglycoside 6'-N-acetyltransferase I
MIRQFGMNDLDNCTKLFCEVFNREPWNDSWSDNNAKEYLLDYVNSPGFIGLVAYHDEQTIGFIFGHSKKWWKGVEYYIDEMCVHPQFQRQGIGSRLFKSLETELSAKGIHTITLLTNRDVPAESFYKKNDFFEIESIVFLAKNI